MFRSLSAAAPRRLLPLTLTAASVLLAACGDNAFNDVVVDPKPDPSGTPPAQTASDTIAPSDSRLVLPLPRSVIAVGDPLNVRVSAADDVGLDSVVVEGFTRSGTSITTRFERGVRRYAATDTIRRDTAQLTLAPRGTAAEDTVYLVATTFDRGGNAASDTTTVSLALIRGTVITLENQTDRLVDLVSDGRRVFVSNFTRNRVEVLDVASQTRSTFRVGSEPWGMAISPDGGALLVANSGGTNISRVNLNAAVLAEDEASRIYTPNVQLFQVPFSRDSVEVVDSAGRKRKVSAVVPSSVMEHDYSDRPQFIAQTASGEIFYSTKPTSSAANGTIRRRRTDGQVEFFLDYALHDKNSSLVIVNARDAGLIEGDPNRLGLVSHEGDVIAGFVDQVDSILRARGSRTYFDYFRNLEDLGLQDTTFVAVSGDHRTVAFGEGAAEAGRVVLYRETQDSGVVRTGDTGDLVNNAAERVIGLALNRDGSLGAARGRNAYFFTPDLRLQGVGETGVPTGGVALHPSHAGYPGTPIATRVGFVSGRDENGSHFIDVFDTFSFFRRQRIFVRRPVTGPIVAVRPPAGSSAALLVYAISGSTILRVELSAADLQ